MLNINNLMKVREPPKKTSKHSPRIKPPKYVYKLEEEISITGIVLSIANGLLIKSVQPELYPIILPYLRLKRDHLFQENNIFALKAVDKALDDIDDYYIKEEEKRQKMRQKEIQREELAAKKALEEEERRKNEHRFTPEEIDTTVSLAMRGEFDQIDHRIYVQLLAEMRKRHKEAVARIDYLKAANIDKTMKKIIMLENDRLYNEITTAKAREAEEKVNELRNEYNAVKEEWKERIAEAERQRDEDINQLKIIVDAKMKEFDQQYEYDVPIQFKKYSTKYRDMREKEKNFILAEEFEEAHQIKELADKTKLQEEGEFRSRYEADLETKRNEFIRKMQERIDIRLDTYENQLIQLRREADIDIEHARKTLRRAEIHQQEVERCASFSNPTAITSPQQIKRETRSARGPSATSGKQLLSMSGPIGSIPNSARGARNKQMSNSFSKTLTNVSRDSLRAQWVRDLKTPRSFQEEQASRDLFKQRRAINNLMYSKTSPRVKKVAKKDPY